MSTNNDIMRREWSSIEAEGMDASLAGIVGHRMWQPCGVLFCSFNNLKHLNLRSLNIF